MSNPAYVLGHAERELERLRAQDRLIRPFTRTLFRLAGIAGGMRVLDVGSGAGDVAILAADFVGASGTVIGVDLAPAAIERAQARVATLGLSQISFQLGDPAELAFDLPFDAIIGRYVLLFQADPAAMLRKLARHLRPGGVIAFHEPDWSFFRSTPVVPLYDRCCRLIAETMRRADTDTNMAVKLYHAFVGAGLPPPAMSMHVLFGGPRMTADWLTAVADLTRTLLPAMEQLNVLSAEELVELDIDSLANRLRREVAAADSIIAGRAEVGAWSRP